MSEAVPQRKDVTPQEYFDFEYAATERHMYLDGQIIAMSGGTYEQNAIIANLTIALGNALRGKPCRPLESNMRVRYGKKARYGYTDGLVVCGPPKFDATDARNLTLLNPTLIVEVLSDSTERFDRGDKFGLYREIESFREYVLVSQSIPRIETFFRQPDATWQFAAFDGIDAIVPLKSIDVTLVARDVYADVSFPPEPATPPADPQ